MLDTIQNTVQSQFAEYVKNAGAAFRNGRLDEAEMCYHEALKLYSLDCSLYNNLGIVYYRKGDLQQARNMLNQSLKINPDYYDANYNIAKVCHKLNDTQAAVDYATHCINLYPDRKKGYTLLKEIISDGHPDHILQNKGAPGEQYDILFVQESPCIRNYKMALGLKKRGHRVSLAYTKAKLSQMYRGLSDDVYDNLYPIKSQKELWELIPGFDIVHCHNEPDVLTISALAGNVPVIHDTHDLISLRSPKNESLAFFEGIANRGSHGHVFTTPYQLHQARKLYNFSGPSIVLYNYTSKQDLPNSLLPKLSQTDNNIHIVYEGGIGGNTHRNFFSLFEQLALSERIHIHIYPTFKNAELEAKFKNSKIHFYDPVSPREIIREMSRYDLGIIPFNLELGKKEFLETTIANKLFEYLAAGLPVITSSLKSYQEFFNVNPVGYTFKNDHEAIERILQLLDKSSEIDFSKYQYTYEDEIYRLEWLYKQVIHNYYHPPAPVKKTRDKEPPPDENESRDYKENYIIEIPADVVRSSNTKRSDLIIHFSKIIINHYKWLKLNGFAGFDDNDLDAVLKEFKRKGRTITKEQMQYFEQRRETPERSRQELGISKLIYPESFGLFLNAFILFPKDIHAINIETEIDYLFETLNKDTNSKYTGWGYPYDRNGEIFIESCKPDVITTYWIGRSIWNLYQHRQENRYLQVCKNIAEFYLDSLKQISAGENRFCYSLSPGSDLALNSVNLFVADFLLTIGKATRNKDWIVQGINALNSSLDQINEVGQLPKYFDHPDEKNTEIIDHLYHLIALENSSTLLEDNKTSAVFETYMQSFIRDLYSELDFPQTDNGNTRINTYTIGLLLYLFSRSAPENNQAEELLYRLIPLIINYVANDSFGFAADLDFQQNVLTVNTFPFYIRNQASMINGMIHVLDFLLNKKA